MALGGGVDVALFHDQFYWRVIQTNYLMTQFGSRAQNNFRASTGIVFRSSERSYRQNKTAENGHSWTISQFPIHELRPLPGANT